MIHKDRINKIRNVLSIRNLDGIYITNLTNVRYLTGFTGSAGSLLIMNNNQYFFSDCRYTEQSKNEIKNAIILIENKPHLQIIKDNKLINNHTIAIESNHLTLSNYTLLKNYFKGANWEKTSGIVEEIAAIKDQTEIDALKKAIQITDSVFTEILNEIKIGVTEKAIAAKISYLFKMHGAEGDSYDPIIASGALGALPHARPSDKKIESGDFIVMDIGALYNGYHADMTRTVLVGEATDKHHEIYSIVLDSQLAGIQCAKAGITGKELDQVCRNVIQKSGYGDKFIHSTGHGIGLEVHTYPGINNKNNKPLLENYVITIEPGIYIPGWGGVRIEDDCWIKKDCAVPLNMSSKELIIL